MNGAPARQGSELAAWVEDGVRRLLREAALGELGTDIGTAADETLIAAGLEAGDAEIAVRAEQEPPPSMPVPEWAQEHATRRDPGTGSLGGDQGPDRAEPKPDQAEQPTFATRGGGRNAGDPNHGADPPRR